MNAGRAVVLAIDGPSGSGKGTVSRTLARRLGWHYLDSGALYRVVAFAARERGIALDDGKRLAHIARALDLRFMDDDDDDDVRVLVDGVDVTAAVRTEAMGQAASQVAAIPALRAALLERQRAFVEPPGLVADGRDMGSTVFPDAIFKVFLTASAEERAKRRHKQLKDKGINVSLPALSREIAERDERDSARPVAPLEAAPDAEVLDSTGLSVAQVVERIMKSLRAAGIKPVSE